MKFPVSACALGALYLHTASAFPAMLFDLADRDGVKVEELYARILTANTEEDVQLRKRVLGVAPGFDAATQRISTSGANAFVAPGPDDIRGPCPGLNAFANHGYIPHNGVATITQFIDATTKVVGMGVDTAAFLSIYGAVIDGDLTSWSIGGAPPGGLLGSIGLLSQPQGLTGSHNKYESDASPTRGDLYQYGNNFRVVLSQFESLFSKQPDAATANYDLPVLFAHREQRLHESIENNPYFFQGPFTGVLVQSAAYTFVYRFMANHSAEHPEGLLNQDVLKSFFSITGAGPGSFVYTPGHEQIPDNWYRRAFGDEYSIPFFLLDVVAGAATYPDFLSIGGNLGTTNSFTGVDVANLTGGVYNALSLTQGNNLGCFAFQLGQQATPDILKGLFSVIDKALEQVNAAFDNVLGALDCPQLEAVDESQFSKFPGYSQLSTAGTYP